MNDRIVNELRNIVDEKPEFYLDEIADELGNRIGVCLPFKNIWLALTEKGEQRDEIERHRNNAALKALLSYVAQVVIVGKMRKYKNELREKRLEQTELRWHYFNKILSKYREMHDDY